MHLLIKKNHKLIAFEKPKGFLKRGGKRSDKEALRICPFCKHDNDDDESNPSFCKKRKLDKVHSQNVLFFETNGYYYIKNRDKIVISLFYQDWKKKN